MPKYNLYKIDKSKQEELIDKLKSIGLIKSKEILSSGFNLQFFYSQQPDEVDIWWTNTYKDFLQEEDVPRNKIFFGTLILYDESICYAVSLGKTHFYLRQFCEEDFGLELAERIADPNNLKIKNSKFHKSIKSKTITTYQDGNEMSFDSGESMHYLKARTSNPLAWGFTASFGSSVQLKLNITPLEIPNLIQQIETELKKPPVIEIPKTSIVKDKAVQQSLDRKLANTIINSSVDKSEISVDEFSVSGVDFIFIDSDSYSIYLQGSYESRKPLEDLSIESLKKFIQHENIDLKEKINKLKVQIHREHGRGHSKPLKFYLDFVDEKEKICLIDGRWHRFNQSYLRFIEREVDSIELVKDGSFDIKKGVIEDTFNRQREKDGYRNFDKNLTSLKGKYKIEKMDLYKDNTLFFVKKGVPQKLSYVIDQALLTIKVLQNNESTINIDGCEDIVVDKICLWLILDRANRIEKISELNSLIFHMKLVEWKKVAIDAGYRPEIRVNYIVNP